jgi:cell division protein DivIC
MKKARSFPLALFIIIIVSVSYGAFVISSNLSQRNEKLAEISYKKQKVEQLNGDINKLNKEIKQSSSIKYVEKVAREELGMVKPKEVVYIDKDKAEKNNDDF